MQIKTFYRIRKSTFILAFLILGFSIASKCVNDIKQSNLNKNCAFSKINESILKHAWKKASLQCDRLIEIEPNYIEGYITRAKVRKELGEEKSAQEDLQKAITLNACTAFDFDNKALAYRQLGHFEKALNCANISIFLGNSSALSTRAGIFCKIGKYENAIADCNEILNSMKYKDVNALIYRGQAHSKLGSNELAIRDFSDAIAILKNLDFLDKEIYDVYQLRALSYFALGRAEMANRDVSKYHFLMSNRKRG